MEVREPYSYLNDPAVPAFDAGTNFVIMDAHCALCARGATWIARADQAEAFRIIPVQSSLGQSLLRHYGLDPADPNSWLYVRDGLAFEDMDALIRVGKQLGGRWRAFWLLRLFPPPLLRGLYHLIARHRICLFGRGDLCNLPDAELQRRLVR